MKRFFVELVVASVLIAATFWVTRSHYVPAVVRHFHSHRASFERTVARVQGMPDLKDEAEAPLDEDIYAAGITYVRKRGDCVLFTYGTFVTDSSWQIVYTPQRFRSLPVKSETGGPFNRIQHIQEIDDQWYCWKLY